MWELACLRWHQPGVPAGPRCLHRRQASSHRKAKAVRCWRLNSLPHLELCASDRSVLLCFCFYHSGRLSGRRAFAFDLTGPVNHAGRSEAPSGGQRPFGYFWLGRHSGRLPKVTRCKSGTASRRYRSNGYVPSPRPVKNPYKSQLPHNDSVVPIEQLPPHPLPSIPTPKTRRKSSWKVQL